MVMENNQSTISQVSAKVLANLISRGISLLNNRKSSIFHREEFRTIEFSWSQYGEDVLGVTQIFLLKAN